MCQTAKCRPPFLILIRKQRWISHLNCGQKREKKIRVKFAFHGQGEGYSADMKVTGLQSCLGACGCSLSPSCVCWAAQGCVPPPLPSPPLGGLCARQESKTFLVSSDSPFVLIWMDVVVNYLLFACLHLECAGLALLSVRAAPDPIFCLLQEPCSGSVASRGLSW